MLALILFAALLGATAGGLAIGHRMRALGAVVALSLLAAYLAFIGRGAISGLIAASLIALLLLVTFDLDRPTRGLITVPDKPLVEVRAEMALPPAASTPEVP